ncbi:MAG: radical SAM protein [Planctomycetota bacterium]
MAYDVLFVSSDSRGAVYFDRERYAYLRDKFGLGENEVQRLLFAHAPVWTEGGVPMSYIAAENWFRNGRRFSLTEEEAARYMDELSQETLTRFGNGLYVVDHMLKAGYECRLINDLGAEWETFEAYVAEGPRCIAISTTFLESRERTEECARRIKAVAPDVPIVVGGPLVLYSWRIREEAPHLVPHSQIKSTYFFMDEPADPAVDVAVIDARGEATLAALVKRLRAGEDWRDLPNLAWPAEDRTWTFNLRVPEFVDVNEEGVAWDELPRQFLGREVAIRGSRGCPLRCKFCSFVVIHPEFEMKKVDVLRDELRKLATRSDVVKHVSFVDDNLFLTRRSVHQYAKMMAEERFPFTFSAFIRVDSVTEENAALLKEAGCNFVMLGIESGDLRMLKTMRKVQHPERVLRTIELLSQHGISTLSTLVVGFPMETDESIQNTIDLLNAYPDHGPTQHWFNCWVNMVIPLTPADTERGRWDLDGILLDWTHKTMDVADAFHARERILREVRRGGAYNGPYAFDSVEPFAGRGEEGWQDMRRFYKLRHRIGCLDYFGLEELDGKTREETLAEVEEIILRTSDFNRANGTGQVVPPKGNENPNFDSARMRNTQAHA